MCRVLAARATSRIYCRGPAVVPNFPVLPVLQRIFGSRSKMPPRAAAAVGAEASLCLFPHYSARRHVHRHADRQVEAQPPGEETVLSWN